MNDASLNAGVSLRVDLSDRLALVTGAGSGLGRRFAIVLAMAGARVILCGRRRERLVQVAEEITAAGGQALVECLDLRNAAALPACIQEMTRTHGTIDILVNNAGIGRTGAALDTQLEEMDELFATNLRAPYILATEVARQLIASGRPGRIVNIASVGALHYSSGMGAAFYCSLKAAVIRMSEALSLEWAKHGINVNAIAPGLFETEMTEESLARFRERMVERLPRKRAGLPEQLDSTLLYLVSPASEFVTGICLRVDDAQYPR
ncbi:SDR family NAD(P)-dependent oxidoreductase [Metapseudomonas boanensis]|uniref:SDR family NAD(P)-dependent oxidoreductase n=1 Tax=Metapseudomonas boanensis TaxID=2822138 RepID=A0ABS5XGC5_9GAMM|nr:SDR family NAD(P)-dependent oxidoreductase [Pseudomonas boanensis]MBT8766754.1 SDR family NAD(P)-dependent oxidoreductase [Pseudomonas boanensis]